MSRFSSRPPVLPIGALPRVDLLPPSEMRRRDMMARARTWLFIGLGTLAVTLLAVGGAVAYNVTATVRLGFEQGRTQQILVGIAELSEVSQAIALRTELSRMGSEAMAGDLEWNAVIGTIDERLPDGVSIIDYALVAGPVPEPEGDPAATTGAFGTVTVTSAQPLAFVDLTRALRGVETVHITEVDELNRVEEGPFYEYRITFTIDQTVYTGAFAPESGEAP
jgi:hypothetical protein